MQLYGVEFEELDEAHLNLLCTESVAESRTLEFKSEAPPSSDSGRREFAKDVAAFANAAGGHIVYGIREVDARAIDIAPIANGDATQVRMEQIVRSHVTPAIPGLRFKRIQVANGDSIIIEIPRGIFGPHMVNGRFVSRGSGGVVDMDYGEIRAAFTGAETATRKLVDFYSRRLAELVDGDTPLPMWRSRLCVMHLMPLASFTPGFSCDLRRLYESSDSKFTPPRPKDGQDTFFNLEGFVAGCKVEDGKLGSYVQCFRNGSFEAVQSLFLSSALLLDVARAWMIDTAQMLLDSAQIALVPAPIYLRASFLNVKGLKILQTAGPSPRVLRTFSANELVLPEVFVESLSVSPGKILRPNFDVLSNASGAAFCSAYNESGEYTGKVIELLQM